MGLVLMGLRGSPAFFARKASQFQSGYVYHYAFAMLIGVVVFISWYVWFAK